MQMNVDIAKVISESIAKNGQPLVPSNFINMGGAEGKTPSAFDMVGLAIADKILEKKEKSEK